MKLLTLILGIAMLTTLGGLAATPTPTPTSNAKGVNAVNVKLARSVGESVPVPSPAKTTTVKSSKSNSSERAVKASPQLITGKVSQVDPKTMTFTLKGKGKMTGYKFFFPKTGGPPKVGDIVEVTYTGTLGGAKPAQSINLNSSRSNIY
jgi:hypothetical protein